MITVDGVTKSYGGFLAVDDVSFACPAGPGHRVPRTERRGQVHDDADHGRPHAGHAGRHPIGGHRYADLPNPGRHVGVLLDASAQHDGRTGREILTLGAMTMGLPEVARRRDARAGLAVAERGQAPGAELLAGHAAAARHRARAARRPVDPDPRRTGQRSGPGRIHWMRGLLKGYAERGGTVLLSSHLLHEVEKIADELILIGHGRIVAQGTKQELLQTRGAYVRAVDTEALLDALRAGTFTRSAVRRRPAQRRRGRSRSARSPPRPASPSSSCGRPTAPAWRSCSSSSPPTPSATPREHPHEQSPRTATETTLDVSGTPRIPLSRLVRVELRKLGDTRRASGC